LIDRIGAEWLARRLEDEGLPVPALLTKARGRSFYRVEHGRLQYLDVGGDYATVQRPDGVLLLSDIKRASQPLLRNASAALWDIGDGITCFEMTTKMNTLNDEVVSLLKQAVDRTAGGFKAMVIYSESANFSLGADLRLVRTAIANEDWNWIEDMVAQGQRVYSYLKHAPVPVIGAPSGMALGGGCELLLHCDAVQAHAETYMGLVEVGVGVIPAWGGCKELLLRHIKDAKRPGGPMPPVMQAFQTIAMAKVSKSAADARSIKLLGPNDGITMNLDRLLADAKMRALRLSQDYQALPPNNEIRLSGPTARTMLDIIVDGLAASGVATPHDRIVCGRLADVLSGGKTDITEVTEEDDLLTLERHAFMSLIRMGATHDRIDHMLETGKPLRN
jgi:3-hydroxyacyl-CoA dehydrogenase